MSGGGHGMDIDEIAEGLTSPEALQELLASLQGGPQPPPQVPSPRPPLVPTSAPSKPAAEQLPRTASGPPRSTAEMSSRTSPKSTAEMSFRTSPKSTVEMSLRTELSDSQSGGESPGGGAGEEPEGGEKRKRLTEAQVQELERVFQAEPTGLPSEKRAAIAREFGVPQSQIASWFHNRRTRQRSRQLKEDFDVLKRRLDLAYLENQQLRHELNALRAEHANCRPHPTTSRGSATGASAPPRSGTLDVTPLHSPDARVVKGGSKRASPEPPSGIATLLIPKRERPLSPGSYRVPSPPQLAALPDYRSDLFRPGGSAPAPPVFASQFARSLLASPPAVPTTPFPEISQTPASFPGANRPARLPSILAPLPLPPSALTTVLPAHEAPVTQPGFAAPFSHFDPTNQAPPPALTGDMTLDEAFREVFTGGPVAVDPLEHPYPPGADPFGYSEGAVAAAASFPMRAPSPSLGNWLWAVGAGSSTAGSSSSGGFVGGYPPVKKGQHGTDREGQ